MEKDGDIMLTFYATDTYSVSFTEKVIFFFRVAPQIPNNFLLKKNSKLCFDLEKMWPNLDLIDGTECC